MVLSIPNGPESVERSETLHVRVNVQAEVLSPNVARHRANAWLTMNAGHLLIAKDPELVLTDLLHWRFDVFLSVPQLYDLGTVQQNRIGQICLDARTGDVIEPAPLIEALKANASTFVSG